MGKWFNIIAHVAAIVTTALAINILYHGFVAAGTSCNVMKSKYIGRTTCRDSNGEYHSKVQYFF